MTPVEAAHLLQVIAAAVIGFIQLTHDFVRLYVALVRQLVRAARLQLEVAQ